MSPRKAPKKLSFNPENYSKQKKKENEPPEGQLELIKTVNVGHTDILFGNDRSEEFCYVLTLYLRLFHSIQAGLSCSGK